MSMPTPIREFAQEILEKGRTSPGLSEKELDQSFQKFSRLACADGGTIRETIASTSLIPRQMDYNDKIATAADLPFDSTALPYTKGVGYPPVVTPVPDFHYGYPLESFLGPQSRLLEAMQHRRLQSYAMPTSSTFWPFFVVEYKSPSRLGSRWVAENQKAGSGAHCVNSIETLMSYTRTTEQRRMTDSVAFSCVVDSDDASLWVHWRECGGEDERFVSSEVGHYHFHRPCDIREFRKSVKNIIDYGLNERLTMIKSALYDVLGRIPCWNAEDKAARVRRSSQMDNESV